MANWQWAAVWKRAAKNYRQLFELCARVSVPLWQRRYWTARRQACAWKAAATKWRRRALKAEAVRGGEWYRSAGRAEYEVGSESVD